MPEAADANGAKDTTGEECWRELAPEQATAEEGSERHGGKTKGAVTCSTEEAGCVRSRWNMMLLGEERGEGGGGGPIGGTESEWAWVREFG